MYQEVTMSDLADDHELAEDQKWKGQEGKQEGRKEGRKEKKAGQW